MRGRSNMVLVPKARSSGVEGNPTAERMRLRKGLIQGTTRRTQSFGAKAKKSWIRRRPKVRVAVEGSESVNALVQASLRCSHLACNAGIGREGRLAKAKLTGISAEVEPVDNNLGLSSTRMISTRTRSEPHQNTETCYSRVPSPSAPPDASPRAFSSPVRHTWAG
jgi:hypothetical protein